MKAAEVKKGQKLILPGYSEPVEVLEIRDRANLGFLEFVCSGNARHTAQYKAEVYPATPESEAIALLRTRDREAIMALEGVGKVTADKILALDEISIASVKEALGEADFANLIEDNFS